MTEKRKTYRVLVIRDIDGNQTIPEFTGVGRYEVGTAGELYLDSADLDKRPHIIIGPGTWSSASIFDEED